MPISTSENFVKFKKESEYITHFWGYLILGGILAILWRVNFLVFFVQNPCSPFGFCPKRVYFLGCSFCILLDIRKGSYFREESYFGLGGVVWRSLQNQGIYGIQVCKMDIQLDALQQKMY